MNMNIKRDFQYWLYCPVKLLEYWWEHRDMLDEAARTALEAIAAFADEQIETVQS